MQQSRREFLIHSAGLAAGMEFEHLSRSGILAPALSRSSEDLPRVCAARGSNSDTIASILKTSLEGLGGIGRFVKPGQTVVIKPNATWAYPPHTASSSDPELLEALIVLVREAGAKRIIVMDHCSIDPGTAESLRVSGIGKVVDKMGVEKVFPDRFNAPKSVYTTIDFPSGKAYQKLGVIKAAVEADVRINLAVAKTHNVTKMTMTLKHMMGFLEVPGLLHAKLEQGIADLNSPSAVQAHLNILEAVRVRLPSGAERVCAGPETDLTHPDRIKRMNQIVAGIDPVLIDAYGCERFFNVKPEELTHLIRSAESGIGEIDTTRAGKNGQLIELEVGRTVSRIQQPAATSRPVELTSTAPAVMGTAPSSPGQALPTTSLVQPASSSGTPTPRATVVPSENDKKLQVSLPQVGAGPAVQTSAPNLTPSETCPASPAGAQTSSDRCGAVLNPNGFLSGALLPAAAIVLGAGMVLMRRFSRRLDQSSGADGE